MLWNCYRLFLSVSLGIMSGSLFLFTSSRTQIPHRTAAWCFPARGTSTFASIGSRRREQHPIFPTTNSVRRTASSTLWATTSSSSSRNHTASSQKPNDILLDSKYSSWREHPAINPTIEFPTLLVPSSDLQRWIQEPLLQPFLAKPQNWGFLHHVHPRIKMIRDFDETRKLVLLSPTKEETAVAQRNTIISEIISKAQDNRSDDDEPSISLGPPKQIPLSFSRLSFQYILNTLMDDVPPPSAYEQIGHVAHFNLKPQHLPFGKLIGEVLLETNPTIETVVNKVGEVSGKYRTYELDILAGKSELETTVVEHGMSIQLDVSKCYWCTRLSGERQTLIKEILKESSAVDEKDNFVIADVFCGVGAVCLLLAKQLPNCTVLANDWNPDAIRYFKKNILKNNLQPKDFKLSLGDSYDFLMDLNPGVDHVLMNFPLEAPTFLAALRWWSWEQLEGHYKKTSRYPRFHVYTFARATLSEEDDTVVIDESEVAVDIVANELLPLPPSDAKSYRRQELDKDFNADVKTRVVRDVAPGKVVVCVSFILTPKLLRYMQGDYS